MGKGAVFVVFLGQERAGTFDQLLAAGQSCAARGLIGADDDAPHAGSIVQWLERHHHLRGRAVRAGDDALMLMKGFWIHLRYDQRNLGVHPPVAAFVDDDGAALDRPGSKIAGHFVRRAADRQVDPFERLGTQLFDLVLASAELDRFPGRSSGCEELDPLVGKLALLQELKNESSHGACCAHDGYGFEHERSPAYAPAKSNLSWRPDSQFQANSQYTCHAEPASRRTRMRIAIGVCQFMLD